MRLFVLICLLPALVVPAEAARLRYNRDIRPILSDNCFYCHGPDKNHRDGKMRLDIRADALKAEAIVPGKPADSKLLQRIHTTDPDDLMPPPESKKSLTDAQKKLLADWIAQGAEYEPHWAYTPLLRPELPKPISKITTPKHPVDAFMMASLSDWAMNLSPRADPRTLIRRVSLDLIGLPPTPEEVEKFVAEVAQETAAKPAPGAPPPITGTAYQNLIARLMKNPHFGERWAAWWLDVARFSDTVGFHGDQNQRIFPYRDYVINAFNSNKRFNIFTLEQLAGDLLPNATTEQWVASGFNRLNMMTREGGAQPKEYLAKYQADRVRTIGGAWLGATLGCAECHDHKFDPFTSKDFYSMAAYFADVKQWGVYSDYGYTKNPDLKGWTNEHPFPPELLVDNPYLKNRLERVEKQMGEIAVAALKKGSRPDFKAWRQVTLAYLEKNPSGWMTPIPAVTTALAVPPKKDTPRKQPTVTVQPPAPGPRPVIANKPAAAAATQPKQAAATPSPGAAGAAAPASSTPATKPADPSAVTVVPDGRILIAAAGTQNTVVSFRPGAMRIAAVKIDLVPDPAHKNSIELNGTRNGMTLVPIFSFRPAAPGATEKNLAVLHADATAKEPRFSSTAEIIGIKTGWKTSAAEAGKIQTAVYLLETPVDLREGDAFTVRLSNHSVGCLRIAVAAVAPLKPFEKDWAPQLAKALQDAAASDPHTAQTWLMQSSKDGASRAAWRRLYDSALECNEGKAWTQVTVAIKDPPVVRRLPRGNWMDESGEICKPAPPEFLAGTLAEIAPRQSRIDLAEWLTSRNNPLTARAFVNRLWKQFFGTGLSSVIDDLGAQGETPSHPELLDWLAVEFRESGWNVQHIMRLIVTSRTYTQDSKARTKRGLSDPQNRLLAYQNPRRLDAEFVRDNALFVAGILNLDIGGPSAKPYQPPGYYENLQFPNRDYVADVDDRQWRRGVYMHWQRTFLHPMLANFDAPARDECTASRNVSNTPQQALTLLNDPTFVEAARGFAEKLPAGPDEARIDSAFVRALARPAKPTEKQSLLAFLKTQRDGFKAAPEDAKKLLSTGLKPPPAGDPVELAAWASLCRVVLNMHETITRY